MRGNPGSFRGDSGVIRLQCIMRVGVIQKCLWGSLNEKADPNKHAVSVGASFGHCDLSHPTWDVLSERKGDTVPVIEEFTMCN